MRRLLLTLPAFLLLAAPAHASWSWPVRGDVITQYRNGSDPYAAGQHRGIDIAAPVGTPVLAAASGEVLFAGTAGSSGLTVSVRTGDGLDTSYLHLSALAVRRGDRVSGGQRLGAVGTTGDRSAIAPHLHFGVREAGTRHSYLDPLSFLPPPTVVPPPAETPHPAPAPAPAPLAPRAAPAPAPSGAPRPAPAPGRVPRPAPAPGRAPRPLPAPGRVPRPEPAPGRVPTPEPAPGRAPRLVPAPGRAPNPEPAPGRAPFRALGPRSGSNTATFRAPTAAFKPTTAAIPRDRSAAQQLAPLAHGTSSSTNAVSRPSGGAHPSPASPGPDIGWALACAGLLLAAAILGLSDEGRKATSRTGSRLAGALRPVLGRR